MDDVVISNEWKEVQAEWSKALQMGAQSVQQAAKVGQMLKALKDKDADNREAKGGRQNFSVMCEKFLPGMNHNTRATLLKLADNLPLLKEKQPKSQREAMKLIAEANPKKKEPAPDASKPETKSDAASSKAEQSNLIEVSLTREEFDLLCSCLQDERVPNELKERFDEAFGIISQFQP